MARPSVGFSAIKSRIGGYLQYCICRQYTTATAKAQLPLFVERVIVDGGKQPRLIE